MSVYTTNNGDFVVGDVFPTENTTLFSPLTGFAPITTDIPTVIVPQDYYDQIRSMSDSLEVFTQVNDFRNSVYEDFDGVLEGLRNDFTLLNNESYMLWGNLATGGIGFINRTADACALVICWGVAEVSGGFSPAITDIGMNYKVTLPDPGDLVNGLTANVLPAGTYDNGFSIYQMWNVSQDGLATMSDYLSYLYGPTRSNQSKKIQETPIDLYGNIEFNATALNMSDDYLCGYTEELPTGISSFDEPYWLARALQRKIKYFNGSGQPLRMYNGTNVFGGAEQSKKVNPYGGGSTSGGGGGYGNQQRNNTAIPDDGTPTTTMLDTGLVSLYNPSQAELTDFASFLFTGITESISNVFKRMLSNPLDGVLTAHMVHFKPTISGMENIKFLGINSGCSAYTVSEQYYEFEYDIKINDFWSSYHDYTETKLQIFIPYCGTYDLDIREFIGGTLTLIMKIDILSGAVVASVRSKKTQLGFNHVKIDNPFYTFTGNCILSMPLSSTDWKNSFNAIIGTAGAILTGNPAAAIPAFGSVMGGGLATTQKAGSIGSNYGYLGQQTPYIILYHPELSVPSGSKWSYQDYAGYPSNVLKDITNIGSNTYLQLDFEENYLKNIHCTPEEMSEIKRLLKEGVWI